MTIRPNRLVALLTPLVFAPLAGTISVLAAKHAPGVSVDPAALEAVFIAGAAIAFGKAGMWLKGWQDWEKREAPAAPVAIAVTEAAPSPAVDAADLDDDFELEDDLLDAKDAEPEDDRLAAQPS